jgi:hypothetical protein
VSVEGTKDFNDRLGGEREKFEVIVRRARKGSRRGTGISVASWLMTSTNRATQNEFAKSTKTSNQKRVLLARKFRLMVLAC